MPYRHIEDSPYHLCSQPELAESLFQKLGQWFQDESLRLAIDSPEKFFFEKGRLTNNQAFFFVKKINEEGYFFCVNEIGWQIFRAHQIVASDTFVRSAVLFDSVAIYLNQQNDITKARLSSERFLGPDQAAMELYRGRLYQHLLQHRVA